MRADYVRMKVKLSLKKKQARNRQKYNGWCDVISIEKNEKSILIVAQTLETHR